MSQERPPAEEVIRGLETTPARIKALANAGYDRVEISRQLGIRYQSVRYHLVRAGITGGLRRPVEAKREPVVVDAMASPREAVSWDVLERAGFQLVGEWTRDSETEIKLDADMPAEPGVYAFVIEDVIAYIGLTNTSLRTRFDQYRRGHKSQRTNARVKKLIDKALADGQHVKVIVAVPDPLEWHGLPVNTAAGLEAGLIQMLRPSWNITGAV